MSLINAAGATASTFIAVPVLMVSGERKKGPSRRRGRVPFRGLRTELLNLTLTGSRAEVRPRLCRLGHLEIGRRVEQRS
jgi:hypothetical protein